MRMGSLSVYQSASLSVGQSVSLSVTQFVSPQFVSPSFFCVSRLRDNCPSLKPQLAASVLSGL